MRITHDLIAACPTFTLSNLEIGLDLRGCCIGEVENLSATLEAQQTELAEAREVLTAKEAELSELTGEHNVELKKFIEARLRIIAELNDALEAEYERIRTFHREAAVAIRRGSCSGCYSAIPSQRIVEMNHSGDKLHTCENCGRVLISEKLADSVEELVEDDQL